MTKSRSIYAMLWFDCYVQPLLEDPCRKPLDCRAPLEDFNLGSSLVHLLYVRDVDMLIMIAIVGDLHPDFAIIACRCEHARIRRVPCHRVAAAFLVTFELLNQSAVVFVPDVDGTT